MTPKLEATFDIPATIPQIVVPQISFPLPVLSLPNITTSHTNITSANLPQLREEDIFGLPGLSPQQTSPNQPPQLISSNQAPFSPVQIRNLTTGSPYPNQNVCATQMSAPLVNMSTPSPSMPMLMPRDALPVINIPDPIIDELPDLLGTVDVFSLQPSGPEFPQPPHNTPLESFFDIRMERVNALLNSPDNNMYQTDSENTIGRESFQSDIIVTDCASHAETGDREDREVGAGVFKENQSKKDHTVSPQEISDHIKEKVFKMIVGEKVKNKETEDDDDKAVGIHTSSESGVTVANNENKNEDISEKISLLKL